MSDKTEKLNSPFGGVLWMGDDLSGIDGGYNTSKQFIEENNHKTGLYLFLII